MRFWFTYIRRSMTIFVSCLFFVPTFMVVRLWPRAGARYLRWFLERCGGGFAKLGQMLAMRFDLLPRVYHDELTRVLDRMPRVPIKRIRKIVADDLGPELYGRLVIEEKPLGSASIAQAHLATFDGGEQLVLKVRRPRIEQIIRVDMDNLKVIAWLLQAIGVFRHRDLTQILREIRRYTEEELDFRREAFNANALHEMMNADDVDHYSPKVFLELCSERVVALERLEGVWLYELTAAVREHDEKKLAAWAEDGITPVRTARLLYRSALEQAYHHRMFHADPHAANVLVLSGGTLAYIDFGIVGWLDEPLRDKQEQMLRHLTRGEIHGAYNALLHLVEAEELRDLAEFECVVKAELTSYLLRVRNPHATAAEKSTGRVYITVAAAVGHLNLRLPTRLTRFYRAQLFVDELALCLHPALDPIAEFTQFWNDEGRRRQRERLLAGFDLATIGAALGAVPGVARELSNWIQYALPTIGRTYGQTLTRLERGIVLGLQYVRRGMLSVAAGAAALLLWRTFSPGVWFDDPVPRFSNEWLVISTTTCALIAYSLGRISIRMRALE